jgi:hypothetical protein
VGIDSDFTGEATNRELRAFLELVLVAAAVSTVGTSQ